MSLMVATERGFQTVGRGSALHRPTFHKIG
jgi:hypothetical protein